jgi:hypothetical protein
MVGDPALDAKVSKNFKDVEVSSAYGQEISGFLEMPR